MTPAVTLLAQHLTSTIPHLPHPLLFFFNDTATTEIYTLSLHDALPIYAARTTRRWTRATPGGCTRFRWTSSRASRTTDRKSTRLNSSHLGISYAVFCLKKKKNAKATWSSYNPNSETFLPVRT